MLNAINFVRCGLVRETRFAEFLCRLLGRFLRFCKSQQGLSRCPGSERAWGLCKAGHLAMTSCR